jgi:hypothetical protein
MFNEKSGEVKLLSRIAIKQKLLLENNGFKVLDNLEYEKPLYVVYKCEKCNKFEIFYKKIPCLDFKHHSNHTPKRILFKFKLVEVLSNCELVNYLHSFDYLPKNRELFIRFISELKNKKEYELIKLILSKWERVKPIILEGLKEYAKTREINTKKLMLEIIKKSL